VNRETGKKVDQKCIQLVLLLQEVMENLCKKNLTIKLNIDSLDEALIHNLKDTLGCIGDHSFKFCGAMEMQEEIKVDLISRKQKVKSQVNYYKLGRTELLYKLN